MPGAAWPCTLQGRPLCDGREMGVRWQLARRLGQQLSRQAARQRVHTRHGARQPAHRTCWLRGRTTRLCSTACRRCRMRKRGGHSGQGRGAWNTGEAGRPMAQQHATRRHGAARAGAQRRRRRPVSGLPDCPPRDSAPCPAKPRAVPSVKHTTTGTATRKPLKSRRSKAARMGRGGWVGWGGVGAYTHTAWIPMGRG